jgi:uncharacterized protein YbaA (DUF1428 family)
MELTMKDHCRMQSSCIVAAGATAWTELGRLRIVELFCQDVDVWSQVPVVALGVPAPAL